MAIEFICPGCGQVLKLRDEARGSGEVSALPGGDNSASAGRSSRGGKADGGAAQGRRREPTRRGRRATKPCPGCGNELSAAAVICVNCGFNLKTGKKLQTVFEKEEEPEEETATGAEEPKERRLRVSAGLTIDSACQAAQSRRTGEQLSRRGTFPAVSWSTVTCSHPKSNRHEPLVSPPAGLNLSRSVIELAALRKLSGTGTTDKQEEGTRKGCLLSLREERGGR